MQCHYRKQQNIDKIQQLHTIDDFNVWRHCLWQQEKKGDQKAEDKAAAKREAEIKKMEDLLKMVRQVETKQEK